MQLMPRFDLYGRCELDVERVEGRWVAYHRGEGKRRLAEELVIPPDVEEEGLERYLDDLLHELGRPGATVRRIR